MLALLECNAREVGFYDNLGEEWVQEYRQELVGIERHRSISSDTLYRVGAVCSWRDFLRKKENRAGSAGRTVAEERVRVASNGVSSGTGHSGERSWAGGMFTNDDLTNGNTLAYQSLVNIPTAQLRSPPRPVTEDTPLPATSPEPALFLFS